MLALDISSLTFVALAIIGGVSAQTAGGYQQVGLPNSPLARERERAKIAYLFSAEALISSDPPFV